MELADVVVPPSDNIRKPPALVARQEERQKRQEERQKDSDDLIMEAIDAGTVLDESGDRSGERGARMLKTPCTTEICIRICRARIYVLSIACRGCLRADTSSVGADGKWTIKGDTVRYSKQPCTTDVSV